MITTRMEKGAKCSPVVIDNLFSYETQIPVKKPIAGRSSCIRKLMSAFGYLALVSGLVFIAAGIVLWAEYTYYRHQPEDGLRLETTTEHFGSSTSSYYSLRETIPLNSQTKDLESIKKTDIEDDDHIQTAMKKAYEFAQPYYERVKIFWNGFLDELKEEMKKTRETQSQMARKTVTRTYNVRIYWTNEGWKVEYI